VTYYRWCQEYGGLKIEQVKRLMGETLLNCTRCARKDNTALPSSSRSALVRSKDGTESGRLLAPGVLHDVRNRHGQLRSRLHFSDAISGFINILACASQCRLPRRRYDSSRFHGLGLPRLLVPDPSSHDPRPNIQIATRLAKTPLFQRQISLCERTRRFYQRFFGKTPSQKLVKRSGECVKNGLGTIFAFPAAAREASPTTGARGYLLSCSRTYSSPLVGLLPTPRLN
jgi:hypothetical protein